MTELAEDSGGGVTALSHVAVHDDGIAFELPSAIAKFFEGNVDRIGREVKWCWQRLGFMPQVVAG